MTKDIRKGVNTKQTKKGRKGREGKGREGKGVLFVMSKEVMMKDFESSYPLLMRKIIPLQGTRHNKHLTLEESSKLVLGKSINFTTGSHKLVGQEDALGKLMNAFNRITNCQSELVLVHGISGSGKSSLISSFVEEVEEQVLYVTGKFDQLETHAPFAALVSASNQLCRKILRRSNCDLIRDRIRAELGPEISLLGNLIPALSNMAEDQSSTSMSGQPFSRFKQLFRSFLRSAATEETPIIFHLDDLQWADAASLEVLKAILTDELSKHILIIVAFRDDEMQSEKLIKYTSQRSLTDNDQDSGHIYHAPITAINIKGLNIGSLNDLISTMLDMHPDLTFSLSKLILTKTDGNPYHALNFLEMLASKQLIEQNHMGEWDWDEEVVLGHTDVTDNLASMLEKKILRLPEQVLLILQLAAFIGHDFPTDILVTIVFEEQDIIETEYRFERSPRKEIESRIRDALSLALGEGFIETTAVEDVYKFSHNRIHSCLYSDLIPEEVERRLLHQRIGRLIWNSLKDVATSSMDDWKWFLAADNLNRGADFLGESSESGSRYELIELNLKAAKLALGKGGFLVAIKYLRQALGLVDGETSWGSHYDLCINLYCCTAEVERNIGCSGRSDTLVEEIHNHAKSFEHRFPAYLIEVTALATSGDLDGAMKLGATVLRQIGVRLMKKPTKGGVMREFILTTVVVGNRPYQDLLELPVLEDQKIIFALQFLSIIAVNAFISGGESSSDTFAAVSLRMVRLTIQYGLSDYAPLAFVAYGSLLSALGYYEFALGYGDVGIELLKRFHKDGVEGKVLLLSHSTIHSWKRRIDMRLHSDFRRLYHLTMSYGDVDQAYFGFLGWLLTGFVIGVPLADISKRARVVITEVREEGSSRSLYFLSSAWQSVLNLIGDKFNNDPSLLLGEAVDQQMESEIVKLGLHLALVGGKCLEILLSCLFENWDHLQDNLLPFYRKYEATMEGYITYPFNNFYYALACYELYKVTKHKKYKREARRAYKKSKKWAEAGTVMIHAPNKILAAIDAASSLKKEAPEGIEDLFQLALDECDVYSYLGFKAIATERFAKFFLDECPDKDKSRDYSVRATNLYRKWGAGTKVQWLEARFSV